MKLPNRAETTVYNKDLTPASKQLLSEEEKMNDEEVMIDGTVDDSNQDTDFSAMSVEQDNKTTEHSPQPTQNRRPNIRFGYDKYWSTFVFEAKWAQ